MSNTWNIVIADRLTGSADVEEDVFKGRARFTLPGAKRAEDLGPEIESADAILAWHDLQWSAQAIARLKKCKVIVRVGAGYDNVDLQAARERGIPVCNVPDYGTHDVADHAMALTLALARGLSGYARNSKLSPQGWSWHGVSTFRLTGKKFGVVGLGRIGTATAMRAKAFGLDVVYFDPHTGSGWDKALGIRRARALSDLAAECDIVSLHAPLTPETRGMIGRTFFDTAKRGFTLINTARGPIVDWPAFTQAFRAGKVGAAGFDVLPTEPLDTADPLLSAWVRDEEGVRDRLLITPHCAFFSQEALVEMRRKAAEEALRVLSGEKPWNQVN